MITNAKDGVLHLSIHTEVNGDPLLSLWDSEEQARRGGTYVQLQLTEIQQILLEKKLEAHGRMQ